MRKKTKLSLYATRKKKRPANFILPRTPKRFRKVGTPAKRKDITPLTKTPKRHRNEDNADWEDLDHIESIGETTFDIQNESENDKVSKIETALDKTGFRDMFMIFFDLILDDKYPLDNIALTLFLETVQFFNCQSTSQMRYSNQSMRFWKAGYRLFNAKFLFFMGGPKNIGDVLDGHYKSGQCLPENARINFAVPSVTTLGKFKISDVSIPTRLPTGILLPVLETISKLDTNNKYMLCADGKKVTAGIDKVGGDVDMFGYEDQKLSERKEKLQNELKMFNSIILDLKDGLVIEPNRLLDCCNVLSYRVKDSRELAKKQEYGLKRFMDLGGEKWRETKYVYAISAFHASLHQIKEFLYNALCVTKGICSHLAVIQDSDIPVSDGNTVDISFQSNMLMLKETNENNETNETLESRFVKQRSSLWFEIRKKANITGSTIHNGLGLRGRKEQEKHIKQLSESNREDDFSDEVRQRMAYGTKHELDAVTTLSSIVIPAIFPNCYYVEEGCYGIAGNSKSSLLIVSPDGSIRNVEKSNGVPTVIGDAVAAVEIKCPYPQYGKVPVHYSLPQYYVCQCLAEMYVLKTSKLIYMSYSIESSTVLQVDFDEDLWNAIWELILEVYDNDNPKIPPKFAPKIKSLKSKISTFVESNVRFLLEVPSVTAENTGLSQTSDGFPFQYSWTRQHDDVPNHFNQIEKIICSCERATNAIESCYHLLRRKASEVMVWVLTNIDRNSSMEIPCSLPVAYGLKDYRLSADAMRKATNSVIEKCNDHGIKICSLSTDGQWIQLMVRDSNGQPLTILQLQKDVWNKVQRISKNDLIKIIGNLNKVSILDNGESTNIVIERKYSSMSVSSKDVAFEKITTSGKRQLWISSKKKVTDELRTANNQTENHDTEIGTDWMPETIVQVLQDTTDPEIQNLIRNLDREVSDQNRNEILENNDMEIGNLFAESEETENPLSVAEVNESVEDIAYTEEHENSNDSHGSAQQVESNTCQLREGEASCVLTNEGLKVMLDKLQNSKSSKNPWKKQSTDTLKALLLSENGPSRMTHADLNIVYSVLKENNANLPEMRRMLKKEKKVEFIKKVLLNEVPEIQVVPRKKKAKVVPTLSKLCSNVLKSRKIPKAVLNVAYARYVFSSDLETWNNNAPINSKIGIEGFEDDIPFWYSYPERYASIGQTVAKGTDCSHNFTHLRVRTCTVGIKNVTPEAWKAVAKSNETRLNMALVEDLLDKQSVPNARTNFSIEVENWMRDHSFVESANLVRIVRNWYDASDTPGIDVMQRIEYLVEMRKYLLENVDFGDFPPPGRYINTIPFVTFEGILTDIDTKLQLHALAGPYNIRSVGSLAAETMVGVLQELNPVSVSIKARDVPTLMSQVVEVVTCKINPHRGFYMRTSRRSGIYPVHESDNGQAEEEIDNLTSGCDKIIPRNHDFDLPTRKKALRKIRFGSVSLPSAPSRGALPVRQWHRKDESKILPTTRLGLEL